MKTRTASPATISASDLAAARLAAKVDASAPVRLIEGRTFAVTTDSDSFMLVTLGRDTGAELNPDRVAGAEHGGQLRQKDPRWHDPAGRDRRLRCGCERRRRRW